MQTYNINILFDMPIEVWLKNKINCRFNVKINFNNLIKNVPDIFPNIIEAFSKYRTHNSAVKQENTYSYILISIPINETKYRFCTNKYGIVNIIYEDIQFNSTLQKEFLFTEYDYVNIRYELEIKAQPNLIFELNDILELIHNACRLTNTHHGNCITICQPSGNTYEPYNICIVGVEGCKPENIEFSICDFGYVLK